MIATKVNLTILPDVPCPYLPGRVETLRAVMASSIDGEAYHAFMDAGFRRSGRMIYQPVCRDCRACVPIRVPVASFRPSTSQRRSMKRNADLRIAEGSPLLTAEKFELYSRYVKYWHDRPSDADPESMKRFLYDSPTETIEFEYRDRADRLLAIGICDVSAASLSSVYFYFDPDEAQRGLGTFGAMHEIAWCADHGIAWYYLGYWVEGCRTMSYKSRFRPHQLLSPEGQWCSAEI